MGRSAHLAGRKVAEKLAELGHGVAGRVIGIEITAASKTLAPGALDDLPAVG